MALAWKSHKPRRSRDFRAIEPLSDSGSCKELPSRRLSTSDTRAVLETMYNGHGEAWPYRG
jgi:hypothetical protein